MLNLFFGYISECIVSIVYINYNLEKHLIGKTRFTELKLPRRIRIRNHRNRIRIKMKRIRNTGCHHQPASNSARSTQTVLFSFAKLPGCVDEASVLQGRTVPPSSIVEISSTHLTSQVKGRGLLSWQK